MTPSLRARIGDSLKGLEDRYGSPKETKQQDGGLVFVRYEKDGLFLSFSLLTDRTEEVDIKGDLSEKEAEVLMARNVPTGATYSANDNPTVPLIFQGSFYKEYNFSDKTLAYYVGTGGQKQLVIKTPKMVEFETWLTENEKKKELAKANQRADRVESQSIQIPLEKKDEPAPPPDIFRDSRAASGGAQMGQDASFASMETALGRYQHKLYLAIGSRWNVKVQQAMAKIEKDRVVVQFHVNPDGSLSDLDIVHGNPSTFLAVISGDSIRQSSRLIGPFPADLLKEKPNGFPWQLAFRFY